MPFRLRRSDFTYKATAKGFRIFYRKAPILPLIKLELGLSQMTKQGLIKTHTDKALQMIKAIMQAPKRFPNALKAVIIKEIEITHDHLYPVRIFDNGGITLDRYTVILNKDVYTLSHNPQSPLGVNQFSHHDEGLNLSDRTDKQIFDWNSLDLEVLYSILERIHGPINL